MNNWLIVVCLCLYVLYGLYILAKINMLNRIDNDHYRLDSELKNLAKDVKALMSTASIQQDRSTEENKLDNTQQLQLAKVQFELDTTRQQLLKRFPRYTEFSPFKGVNTQEGSEKGSEKS